MSRLSLIVIALIFNTAPLFAQQLSPEELIAFGKYRLTKIDSIVLAKGFNNKRTSKLGSSTATDYVYSVRNDTGIIQRGVQAIWTPKSPGLDLQYNVWQKADADQFISELLQLGFKRTVRITHIAGISEGMESVVYKKGTTAISYNERRRSSEDIFYSFYISFAQYKP
jgi:hypothetical protein